MTVLSNPRATIYLYRHCDGYPAEAGRSLVDAIKAQGQSGIAEIAQELLTPSAKHKYELVDYQPDEQGDLEHVYVVTAYDDLPEDDGSTPQSYSIEHRSLRNWSPASWVSAKYSVSDFEAFVSRKEAELQERWEKLQAELKAKV